MLLQQFVQASTLGWDVSWKSCVVELAANRQHNFDECNCMLSFRHTNDPTAERLV
jgi:hypothetical protein